MASKVYFTNFRTTPRENLPQKLARLVKKAGMLEGIDFSNKYGPPVFVEALLKYDPWAV